MFRELMFHGIYIYAIYIDLEKIIGMYSYYTGEPDIYTT